jgi:hypothetical protein
VIESCHGCGLEIERGTSGCQAAFNQFRARETTELAVSHASTRLTIDIYCLQHPDRYCASAKSLAAHLTGVCWAPERGGHDSGLRLLQRRLNGRVDLQKPAIPAFRGELTIGAITGVKEPAAYLAVQDRWARSTWAAYASLHQVARSWNDQAIPPS